MPTAIRQRDEQLEPATIAEFDAFVAGQPDEIRYELIDGVIVLMANPSEPHEEIVANIGAPLKLAMRKRNCRVYHGGMAIQASSLGKGKYKPRPDIVVRCGDVGTGNFITDPLVVVEVLSPSTMDDDRGRKLEFYRSLQTLQHIVLVYQDEMRVEHYTRSEIGWELEPLSEPDAVLDLKSVAFEISLSSIYADAL